jgi:uncharacterized protein
VWIRWVSALSIIVADAQLLAQEQEASAHGPVIDAHWHSTLRPGDLAAPDAVASRREAIRTMDSLGVRYVVVTGVPDALAVWREELANRAVPALLFPCEGGKTPNFGRPCFPKGVTFPDTAWLHGEINAGRIKALGEITAQYLGIAPNDPRLEPYFSLAEELDIPIIIHLGLGPPGAAYPSSPVPRKSPHFRTASGRPLLLEDVLLRHKRLRVFVMHAGWPFLDEMIAILYYHPQVYVDLAGLQSLLPRVAYNQALRELVDAGFGDRIMFGSDATENGLDWLRDGITAVKDARFLSKAQRHAILYDNAARFFRLDSLQPRR